MQVLQHFISNFTVEVVVTNVLINTNMYVNEKKLYIDDKKLHKKQNFNWNIIFYLYLIKRALSVWSTYNMTEFYHKN